MRNSISRGIMRLVRSTQVDLPSFGVIFAETCAEVLVPAGVHLIFVFFLAHVDFVWILLEVGNVMCSMSALKNGIYCLRFLLTFPEKVLPKTDS